MYDARPYHWSFLEGHLDCWNTYLSCIYHIWGDIPPRTTFSFVSCSLSLGSEPFIIIRLSSDYSCSRSRPNAQFIIWAFNPTETLISFFNFEKIKYFDLDLRNCKLQQQLSHHFSSRIGAGYFLSNESGIKYNLVS